MMKKLAHLTSTIIILMSFQTLHAENSTQDTMMTISPGRCVVEKKGDSCRRTISFRFNLPKSGDYCVYKDDDKKPVFCFAQSDFTARQQFSLKTSATFALIDQTKQQMLMKRTFEFLSFVPAKPRRKRKHAWGIL